MSKIYFSSLSSKDKEILDTMLTQPLGEEGVSLFSLMNKLGLTDQQKYLLWEVIINSMQNGAKDGFTAITENGTELSHKTPIRQQDIDISKTDPKSGDQTLQTLISIIEDFCDLPDDESVSANSPVLKSELFKNNLDISTPNFWNESIEELARTIYDLFKDNDNIIVLEIEQNKDITVQTLKDADAGNNFKNGSENSSWVIPWWNIDKKNYDEVRWTDQITDILKKKNKLQYINNHSNWITLLMPQYGRRVEIEDLDRNFWVIAEVIDGISSWIFDTSPIPEIIKKLIDETAQLWENILYLWAQIALMNQKKDDSVRTISYTETTAFHAATNPVRYGSIPIVTAKFNSNGGYEIIRADQWAGGISAVANSFSDTYKYEAQYSEQTLCFCPKTRVNVYHHNYYSADLYEKIVVSKLGKVSQSQNQDKIVGRERKIYKLYEQLENGVQRKILITPRGSIEPEDEVEGEKIKRFSPYIYGTNFDGNKYLYTFPFSETESRYSEKKSIYLYGALRTIPKIKTEINEQGEVNIKSVVIDVYDAAADIILKRSRKIGYYEMEKIIEENGETKILFTYKRLYNPKNRNENVTASLKSYSISSEDCENISSSYYLGEVASWRMKTAIIKESKNLFKNDAILLKIGNFLPATSATQAKSFLTAYFSGMVNKKNVQITTQMRGNFSIAGSDSGTKIYFYSPDWSSYLPNNDLPDKTPSGFCFSKDPSCIANGKDVTETFLARTGMVAAQQYLLKVKELSGHPHKDLWKTPCFFTTFVGLTPWQGPGQFYWDISMVCHVYKYIPAMASMDKQETLGANYADEYKKHTALQFRNGNNEIISGIVKDSNGTEIGKIITYHFINRFESYYDAPEFSKAMLTPATSLRGAIYDQSGWRAIKMIGAANEEDEYCRLLTIDYGQGGYAYDVHFSEDFEGIVQYYDARKAIRAGHVYDFLTDYTIGTNYQVSEGQIKIQNKNGQTSYSQEQNGAIRNASGSSFQDRKNKTVTVKEQNPKETNFLIREGGVVPFEKDGENYKPLIYGNTQTPQSRFGAWTPSGDYYRTYYAYSST